MADQPDRPTIRPARPDDADAVFPLARDMATSFEVERGAFDRSFQALLASAEACLLVADGAGEVSGASEALHGYLLGFRHETFFANGPVAWMEELAVSEADRRSGTGRALVAAFEQWAEAAGCRLVALATRRAAPFYEALGYERSAEYLRKLS